jgi:O-antigen/teichoic acid export membrane protein
VTNRKKSFFLGTIALNIKNVLFAALGMILTPFLLKNLDDSSYGVWILLGNVLSYINLFDFGITGTSNTLIARVQNKDVKFQELVSNIFVLQLIISGLILFFGILLSDYFSGFFNLSHINNIQLIFITTVVSFAISFPLRVFSSTLIGLQLIHHNALIDFFSFLFTFSIQILLVKQNFGLISLPIGIIISKVFTFIFYYLYVSNTVKEFKINYKSISFQGLISILNVSKYWFIGSISALLIYSSDNILIGKLMGAQYIAAYTISIRLFEFIKERIYSINAAILPGFAQLYSEGNLNKISDVYLNMQKLIFSISIFVFQFVFFINEFFVDFWVGKQYYIGNLNNFFFSIYLFCTLIFHSSSVVISSTLKVKNTSLLRLLEAIINLVFSIILVQKFGYIGLIISTCAALILTNFWYSPYKVLKMLSIPFKYFFEKVIQPLLGLILFVIILNFSIFYFSIWEYKIHLLFLFSIFYLIYYTVFIKEYLNSVIFLLKRKKA